MKSIVGFITPKSDDVCGFTFVNLKGEQYIEKLGKWSSFILDVDVKDNKIQLQQRVKLGMLNIVTEIPKFVK